MKHLPLLILILLTFITRAFSFDRLFAYNHDNDLSSWMVKDIVVDKHVRLIGQLTSAPGIFIGPFFYYLLVPFYLVAGMNPLASVWLSVALSLVALISLYFIVAKIYDKRTAFLAGFIYTFSSLIIFTDRDVVPTTLVFLWSIWMCYAVFLVKQKNLFGWWLGALLTGFVWHINLALIMGVGVWAVTLIANFQAKQLQKLLVLSFLLLVFNLPLIVFETRHGFQQSKALLSTLAPKNNQDPKVGVFVKFNKTYTYLDRNLQRVFGATESTKLGAVVVILVLFAGLIVDKLRWEKLLWLLGYLAFFTFHSIPISEYYLNGLLLPLTVTVACLGSFFARHKVLKFVVCCLLMVFSIQNIKLMANRKSDGNGYTARIAVVRAIHTDMQLRNYPCVSISYITSPGRNLGYRYLLFSEHIKTRPIGDKVPVYSIVFPLSSVDKFDQSFEATGLIYPDYAKYDHSTIIIECQKADYNLEESMFGFTK